MTLRLSAGSIVNFVRSQSHDAPRLRNWLRMMPPCFSFHSHAWLKNSSRVSEPLSMPSALSFATTLASVAIDAWSVPGTQQAFLPCIRARRTSTSWIVSLSMCPMCSMPVTFGGGMTIV